MELILASGSPRRKELLALITPEFTVHTSDVDESVISAPAPELMTRRAAMRCRAGRQNLCRALKGATTTLWACLFRVYMPH